MLCSNCGKNEAKVRYTRIINGEKTEFAAPPEGSSGAFGSASASAPRSGAFSPRMTGGRAGV